MGRGEDSSTHRESVERGRVVSLQAVVVLLGANRVGPPSEEIEAAVLAITEYERLMRIAERIVDPVTEPGGWDDLLATP